MGRIELDTTEANCSSSNSFNFFNKTLVEGLGEGDVPAMLLANGQTP